MKKYLFILSLLAMTFTSCDGEPKDEIELAKPTAAQLAFMDMEVGAFMHYGLNVYTGQEHGDGQQPASLFNPTELDADQWVRAARDLGAKYAVLTVRHEGGFCLWPTKTTDYSIASSPYKDGKGDIAKDFADACHKYGLKLGFYFSTMYDAHHIFKADDEVIWGPKWDKLCDQRFAEMSEAEVQAFCDRQVAQLTELLTNYGEVAYIWNDHWGNYMQPEIQKIVTQTMHKLQPNCLMLGPDVTTPGNEQGYVVYPCWNTMDTEDGTYFTRGKALDSDSVVGNNYGLLENSILTGQPYGKFWRSRECTTNSAFHTGGWFWHPADVKETKSRSFADHMSLYYRSVGLGANTIINLPPDNRGLVPDDIAAAAKAFGDEIKARFASPVATKKDIKKGDIVELSWDEAQTINTIVLMEQLSNGQRIAEYTLEAWINDQWVTLTAANDFNVGKPYNSAPGYETIGHKKIDRVEPVVTRKIRFRALKVISGKAQLRSIEVYNCAPMDQKTI